MFGLLVTGCINYNLKLKLVRCNSVFDNIIGFVKYICIMLYYDILKQVSTELLISNISWCISNETFYYGRKPSLDGGFFTVSKSLLNGIIYFYLVKRVAYPEINLLKCGICWSAKHSIVSPNVHKILLSRIIYRRE